MKKYLIWLGFFFGFLGVLSVFGEISRADTSRIRAKIGIGILSGENLTPARSREILTPGDMIRIYVHSTESSYVYVVYSEKETARLLNMTMQKIGESTLCLPSAHAYYKVDGKSPMEKFAVICSPDELPEISGMPESGMPLETWSKIINDLSRKSKIELSHEVKPVIEIGGTVRGKKPGGHQDQFVEDLPFYSGSGFVVKTYEFKVQN